MPTSYTSLLGLALPVTGELSGVWGDTVNDYITNYLDGAVAGTQTISGSQTAVTLSKTTGSALTQAGSGATGSSQYSIINCTGNPASLLTITAPAASKPYIVINATSTSQQVKLVGAGPTTGVTLESGERAVVAWNGSDFVKIATSTADGVTTFSAGTTGFTPSSATSGAVTLAGTLATTNGGTGLTSFTANRVFYASSTSAIGSSANLTFDGNNLGVGATTVAARVDIVGGADNQFRLSSNETNATTKEGKFLLRHYTNAQPNFLVMYPYSTSTDNAVFYGGGSSSQTAATFHAWMTAANNTTVSGTEQMRLTSTGLGIGTSSPAYRLQVETPSATGNAVGYFRQGSGAVAFILSTTDLVGFGNGATSGETRIYADGASGVVTLRTNSTTRATITAAGFTQPVAYADTVSALGNTGTATTINLQNANVFTATLTGNCTFTLSNPIATGSSSFTLILTNDGTAGRTVAWSGGSFVFPGGAASLSRTTTANAVDVWVFFTPNGGTTWYGNIAMKDMKA